MYSEATPNPNALKFILGKPVVTEGYHLFSSLQEASGLSVLEDILSLPGILSVLLAPEFITVNKADSVPWSLLESILLSAFHYHLETFPLSPQPSTAHLQDNRFFQWTPPTPDVAALCETIESIIETRIRPAIEADGGIITFQAFEDGIVYVKLQGACSSCPHSAETLKGGIEQTLSYLVPEVREVAIVA
jgi:Fe-S cluster biogenesis protein NfuA